MYLSVYLSVYLSICICVSVVSVYAEVGSSCESITSGQSLQYPYQYQHPLLSTLLVGELPSAHLHATAGSTVLEYGRGASLAQVCRWTLDAALEGDVLAVWTVARSAFCGLLAWLLATLTPLIAG